MGLFKRLAGFLGFVKDEEAEATGEENSDVNRASSSSSTATAAGGGASSFASASQAANHMHRRGFGVPVQVPVDRGPLLVLCNAGDGGVQGLRWFAKRLRVDEDGDVADEFLEEVSPVEHDEPAARFEVKYSSRPAKVRSQALTEDGIIRHCVEYQGKQVWV